MSIGGTIITVLGVLIVLAVIIGVGTWVLEKIAEGFKH